MCGVIYRLIVVTAGKWILSRRRDQGSFLKCQRVKNETLLYDSHSPANPTHKQNVHDTKCTER